VQPGSPVEGIDPVGMGIGIQPLFTNPGTNTDMFAAYSS
jgi:hypothetical protein